MSTDRIGHPVSINRQEHAMVETSFQTRLEVAGDVGEMGPHVVRKTRTNPRFTSTCCGNRASVQAKSNYLINLVQELDSR
jgi:hypothetical protein